MQTLTKQYEAGFRVKGSKFLSFISPCSTTDEADSLLGEIKDDHPSATHHCYAYRIDPQKNLEFSQDDGEPSGTAGLPILNQIRSAELINVMAVVVRYYGGTKLGKSGLIEAYGHATTLAFQKAELKKMIAVTRYSVTYSYDQQTEIDKLRHSFNLIEVHSEYTEHVHLILDCPTNQSGRFENRMGQIGHLLINWDKTGLSSQVIG